jgi:hypothetical protein
MEPTPNPKNRTNMITINDQLAEAQEELDEKKRETLMMKNPNSLEQREKDNLTMEMMLIDISNGIREYYRRGGDPRILHDSLINTMTYRELNEFISAGDAYLRSSPKY